MIKTGQVRFLIGILTIVFSSAFAEARKGILLMPHLITPPPQTLRLTGENDLLYYGGPIISQVEVVTIFWNGKVAPIVQKEMAQFYTDFVNSNQIDWLNEYKTDIKAVDGREGTHQSFQRGSHLLQVTLNPKNTSLQLKDSDVKNEIMAQIQAGVLPKPTPNVLYMIHFGPEISISIEGMASCTSFGGYHTFGTTKEGSDFFYSVLPDCSGNLSAEVTLAKTTFVASHELIEAITDPYPTPGNSPSYPQAWNTVGGWEISDICAWSQTQFTGTNRSYSVTQNWSNRLGRCYDGK